MYIYTYIKRHYFVRKKVNTKKYISEKQEGWEKNKAKVKTNINQMGMERENVVKN